MPAVTVAPGGYLLVFASGIEGGGSSGELALQGQSGYYHTNFTLDGEGEYLALVSANLTVVQEYGSRVDDTEYPPPAR